MMENHQLSGPKSGSRSLTRGGFELAVADGR